MAYDKKQYVRVNWKNKPSTATPLDEVNLNNMDNFLNVVDNTLIQFEAQKLNIATANSMIASLTIDTDSGIITAKQLDGTTFTWDLNIEKIPVSFSLSEDGILTMITEDGTEWTCDIAELIKEYVFDDSETIAFTREISEEDGSIHIGAAVKEGSIKSEHLNPDYRADIQEYTNQAEQAANESLSFSKDAKRWAVGDEEYEGSEVDNSKYYKEQAEAAKTAAEQARDEAQAVADIKVMAPGVLGIGKPDNTTIEVASDGTISAKEATSTSPGISRPDGTTLGVEEGVMKMIADATSLLITDNQELVVEKVGDVAQKTTTQLLIDTIAQKVANELVTNSALTTTLANYVTKAMMSNVQVNDQNKVPTSALVYGMNEDISELNSNLNTHFPTGFIQQTNLSNTYKYSLSSGNDGYMYLDNKNLSTGEVTRFQFSKNGNINLLAINGGKIDLIGTCMFVADKDIWTNTRFADGQVIPAKSFATCDTGFAIPEGKTFKTATVIFTGSSFVHANNIYIRISDRHIITELSNVSDNEVTINFALICICYGI